MGGLRVSRIGLRVWSFASRASDLGCRVWGAVGDASVNETPSGLVPLSGTRVTRVQPPFRR